MKIGKWSIIVQDKRIVKQYGEEATLGFIVENNSFWQNNVSSNIKAIQYTGDNLDKEQVEYNDGSPHSHFTGDIKKFADEWDKAYLLKLQNDWDNDTLYSPDISKSKAETEEEKITRIGSRPTSYVSTDIY
jgi:hypothetical protein